MSLTVSPTDDQLTTVLGNFLVQFCLAGTQPIVGQVNQVAEPTGPNFIVMTSSGRTRLATDIEAWDMTAPPTELSISASTQFDVQLDVHGPLGADNAQIITTMMRSSAGAAFFDASGSGYQTLFASEPIQAPFVNAESQYEDRWIVKASIQGTPTVSVAQDFADTIAIDLVDVDVVYPAQ